MEHASDLPRAVAGTSVGREVRLSVIRDGRPVTLAAKIAALDAKEASQADGGEKAKPALGAPALPSADEFRVARHPERTPMPG